MEFKVYITVDIDAEDTDKAFEAFDHAIDEFMIGLDASIMEGDICGYEVIDIEQK